MLTESAGVGLTALVVLIMGAARTCVKAVVIYAGVVGVFYLCGLFPDNVLSAVIPMFAVCFRKVAQALFFAGGIIATTKVGELVAAMQTLRIPKPIVITFAVTLRFFPSANSNSMCRAHTQRHPYTSVYHHRQHNAKTCRSFYKVFPLGKVLKNLYAYFHIQNAVRDTLHTVNYQNIPLYTGFLNKNY